MLYAENKAPKCHSSRMYDSLSLRTEPPRLRHQDITKLSAPRATASAAPLHVGLSHSPGARVSGSPHPAGCCPDPTGRMLLDRCEACQAIPCADLGHLRTDRLAHAKGRTHSLPQSITVLKQAHPTLPATTCVT